MFDTILGTPIDALEQELRAGEQFIARVRVRQAEILRTLDSVEVYRADGAASLQEWTRARLDVNTETARALVTAAYTLMDEPRVRRLADHQEMSFDRLVATARLAAAGADDAAMTRSLGFDIDGVARLTNRSRRVTRFVEEQVFRDRRVTLQPSLDGSQGRAYVCLPGMEFTIFEDAVTQRADEFNDLPGPRQARSQRMADALVSIAQDSLNPAVSTSDHSGEGSREPLVTVFVDADLAAATGGEAGAEIAYGPRVGPNTLERILCTGAVRLVGLTDGRPVVTSGATKAIPPAVRQFVMWRDGGCTADGCTSRYRLQPHHIRWRTDGGDHDPDNLTTLCWFHHHVVIHGLGYRIDPDSPPQRRRFMLGTPAGPDPP
jgi:hypothetical protein